MSKFIQLLSMVFLAFYLNGVGLAAETAPMKEPATKVPAKETAKPAQAKKKTAKAKKPKIQKFVGNISAVDTKTGAVSVKGTDAEKNFITQDAAKDALERLAVGDRVRIQYSEKDGKLAATSVRRVKLAQTKTTKSSTPTSNAKTPVQQKPTKDAVK